jgi:hypothetical protein
MTEQLTTTASDSQSRVILEMERKLNPAVFWRRLWKTDKYCTISTAQYWDWLTYIDVNQIQTIFNDRMITLLSGRYSR